MKSLIDSTNKLNTTCSCDDPIECLRHMFCDLVQKNRVEHQGQCPARRPVFLRTHGIVEGTFTILEAIPAVLKAGLFATPGTHPVYIRYSSDLNDGRPDWLSTIGIGIKVFDVSGDKFVSDNGANTADFLLQNVPFFFVDTARDMCNFTKAALEGWDDDWIQQHAPGTTALLNNMEKQTHSVFETPLWSVVPFQLGESHYGKYILRPGVSTFAAEVDSNDPDFLGKDLAGRMAAGRATLDFYVQLRPDAADVGEAYVDTHFPLDRATVTWDERVAVPIKVATIELPQQDITAADRTIYGDWLSFNIGRVPLANKPVGSIAEARISVYQTSANYRRAKNDQPVTEPTAPGEPVIRNPVCPFPHQKPTGEQPKALTDEQIRRITHVRIHPGIGVARVGNSASDYYIGPEVFRPAPTAFGSTRDAGGAIKRQAARFRIYGYDKDGDVVAEVQQADNTTIQWTVHLANKKAAWYQFNAAMDIPATVSLQVPLRNAGVTGGDRRALAIDTGRKTIMGLNMHDDSYVLSGTFQGTDVTLGELRTDAVGRLVVLPGFGVSASPAGRPIYQPSNPDSFNNADGWYDDIADGPVQAKVTIGALDFVADPAWVVSAPPNFAPDLIGWRTMDDLLQSVYMQCGLLSVPQRISFTEHVRPILERLSEMQWVNKGYLAMFGAGAPLNFTDPALLRKLATVPADTNLYPDPYLELRRTIYNSFRPTNTQTVEAAAWPWNYSDAYGYTNPDPLAAPSPLTYMQLPPFYNYVLTNWVNGLFINDYDPAEQPPQTIADVDLQKQPDTLDRAAMRFCLADAFHPGAELTWPMRNPSMYRAPYRIRLCEEGLSEPTYGAMLTNSDVLAINGPLYGQRPGTLTRWMALPWQGDTAYCRSGYEFEYDPYVPTFWPARVPNQVLTEVDYHTLCDLTQPLDIRLAAFQNRPGWLRQLPSASPAPEQMLYMVAHFGEMGILEAKPRPDDLDWLPAVIYVENLTNVKKAELAKDYQRFQKAFGQLGLYDRKLAEAGWISEEQRNEFDTIKRRGL
ncbi:hypothetical protein CLV58_1246 [Spirosoma oryzae]|uniref:Catalase n=1 Tax=Spirosoma oryzae TaxID=1469603 RepID=A0A2T0SAD0_9BACT|nr:LodA/GoxA family CTQ-dependent oxidase [Spirosoma oryzae]PRY30385.1 hypothetical protein CLV58_1246 [Spirosoma oryzae]